MARAAHDRMCGDSTRDSAAGTATILAMEPEDVALAPQRDPGERQVPRIPLDAFGNIGVPRGLKNAAGITWRLLVLIAGFLVLLKVLGLLGGVAMAIFFSLIVAALAGPMQRRLRRIMPDALATVLAMLLMILFVLLVFAFVVKSIVNEWGALQAAAQGGLAQMESWLRTGPLHMDDTAVNNLLQQLQTWIATQGTTFAKTLPGTLGSAGDFITVLSVLAFGSFFFLNSGPKIWDWTMSWVPLPIREEVDNAGLVTWQAVSGYTRGIILVAIADGFLVFVGLMILRVPLAAALAVVVMFGALIPVIGAPIATLFAAVVALATEGLTTALLVVALTIVVGSFDGDIMQPLIMGHAVQLHPLAIVSVIAVGTLSFGVIGALLGVPVAATFYSLAKYLTGRSPAPRDVPEKSKRPRLPAFLRRKKYSAIDPAAEPAAA